MWPGFASGEAEVKKYVPDFAQQYIPEPYQKYIPDYAEDMEMMEDPSWDGWEEEVSSSSLQSSSEDKVFYGPASLSNGSYRSVAGYGPLKLIDITIEQSLKVYGPLTGTKIQAAFLQVNGPAKFINLNVGKAVVTGPANLMNTHVKGELTVYGPLSALKSTFEKPIRVFTSAMRLKDCEAQSIILEKDKNFSGDTSRLYLLGNTKIFGNIEFKGAKGIVEAGPNAKIEGKVINGVIQDKEK